MNKADLLLAVQAALNGDWDVSHEIAQVHADPISNWIHAVLHKIEGDEWNSKYWYSRTSDSKIKAKYYEEFSDAVTELKAIQQLLNQA